MSRDIVPTLRDPFWQDPFFSETWGDFERMRQQMVSQSKDFWGKMDADMANFDDMVRRQHADMDSQMRPQLPQLPRWAIPDHLKDKWTPTNTNTDTEVIKVNDKGEEKFEVTLDVSQYKPEELKVSTVNNVLAVEAKHEEKSGGDDDQGGSNASSVFRHFSRKWTLPNDCRPEDVVSNLSSDGILLITAPRNNALTNTSDKPAIK